VQDMTKVTMTD